MEKANGKVLKDHNVIHMKVITSKIRNMDMEFLVGLVGIFIKGNIKMMKEMVMEK
jgi:hypothetical protein